jgi:hypothetical protein
MPSNDNVKYILHLALIGALSLFGYFFADMLFNIFNALVAAGVVSNIAVQCMESLRLGVFAFPVLAFIFASLSAILVANARSHTMSPLYSITPSGSIYCFVSLMAGIVLNLAVTIVLDMLIVGAGQAFAVEPGSLFDLSTALSWFFSAAHIMCVLVAAFGVLMMVFYSLKTESLEWGGAYGA